MRLAIMFMLAVAAAQGAAVFKGRLVRNEVNGAPVAGASVRAPGANPAVSRSPHGDFRLEFPGRNPGDRVPVSVAMDGMVVVNWVQLEVVLAADPDANELTLILAREADREEMARRFFRLRSVEAIEASYKRLLVEGKRDRVQLQKELEEAKAGGARAAEELAKVRPGQASALYEDAMRLLAEGKVDEALAALDEVKLRRLGQEAKERKEQAEKQLAEATRTWLLRGKLLTTKFRFAEAEKAYAAAVEASPGDYRACFEQAYFLASLNRHQSATQGYVKCLAIARSHADPVEIAAILNNLGNLHRDQNRMEEARKAYEEALGIRRQLTRANPDTYLPYVATTLNNLGSLHRDQNRMEEARKAYEEALGTYRQLARANPDTYLPYVARVLRSRGRMYAAMNQKTEARQDFQEAVKIFQKFATQDPPQYQPFVDAVMADLARVSP